MIIIANIRKTQKMLSFLRFALSQKMKTIIENKIVKAPLKDENKLTRKTEYAIIFTVLLPF